jgi:RNA ligase (TIGR02306 family)
MSTFSCPVVRVATVMDHPNADRLSIITLEGMGFTCISAKLTDGAHRYAVDDLVVYIPSDSVLPEWLLKHMGFWNDELGKGTLAGSAGDRVKPMRLRGVFSDGVLYPAQDGWDPPKPVMVLRETGMRWFDVGEDAAEHLGITKYVPPVPVHMAGEVASLAEAAFKYDFERWERVPDMFAPNEHVTATEKLHGTCCIIQYFPNLHHAEMFEDHAGYRSIMVSSKGLGSQGLVFKDNAANENNIYVKALRKLLEEHNLSELMHAMSKLDQGGQRVAILGEVFGKGVQDLHYGTQSPEFRVFDMKVGDTWLSQDAMDYWCKDVPQVPVLYRGPFDLPALEAVRDGVTTVGGDNIREGVVVGSLVPGDHDIHGRKICKMISPDYLTRKASKGADVTEYT